MLRSPPSRRRGLKSCIQGIWINTDVVASFAEAWIEIVVRSISSGIAESPPSRRRGLKSIVVNCSDLPYSRLLRGGVD